MQGVYATRPIGTQAVCCLGSSWMSFVLYVINVSYASISFYADKADAIKTMFML